MDVIQSITSVFGELTDWLVSTIGSFESVFYVAPTADAAGHLTLMGTLTLVSVGIGIGFLLFNLIRGFFNRV